MKMFWQRYTVDLDIPIRQHTTFPHFPASQLALTLDSIAPAFGVKGFSDGPPGCWIKLYLSYLLAEVNLSPLLLSFL